MYCILLDSTKPNYIPFLKFLLENKPNGFEIIDYTTLESIDWAVLEKYDYAIVLNRFCYVNFSKLIEFIKNKNPKFAGLSTYWGVGFPYLSIISKEIIAKIVSDKEEGKYFDDNIENFYCNILLRALGLSDMKDLLSKSEEELKQLYELNNIELLDSFCYINNIDYTQGYFHNSIFVSFNDQEETFKDFLTEYHSGKKYIKYKQKPYRLDIGKQFFVIKNYHVGIIDKNTVVFWDRPTSSWKKPGNKLLQKISTYIKKNFGVELDSKPDSV
jgi:hypothetical protein